jgi:hypothetical protein
MSDVLPAVGQSPFSNGGCTCTAQPRSLAPEKTAAAAKGSRVAMTQLVLYASLRMAGTRAGRSLVSPTRPTDSVHSLVYILNFCAKSLASGACKKGSFHDTWQHRTPTHHRRVHHENIHTQTCSVGVPESLRWQMLIHDTSYVEAVGRKMSFSSSAPDDEAWQLRCVMCRCAACFSSRALRAWSSGSSACPLSDSIASALTGWNLDTIEILTPGSRTPDTWPTTPRLRSLELREIDLAYFEALPCPGLRKLFVASGVAHSSNKFQRQT